MTRYKKTYRRKNLKGRSRFSKAVKRVIMSVAEKKRKDTSQLEWAFPYDITEKGYPIYHNSMQIVYLINNNSPSGVTNLGIFQGDQDDNRNGNEIYSKGIMFRSTIKVSADRKNSTFRMFLVEFNSSQGNPGDKNDFFHNITGSVLLDPKQTDRFKAQYLGTYRVSARDLATTQASTIIVKKWIPFKRHLSYTTDNSGSIAKGMKEHLAVVMVAYDTTNTIESDKVGFVQSSASLYYADP